MLCFAGELIHSYGGRQYLNTVRGCFWVSDYVDDFRCYVTGTTATYKVICPAEILCLLML